tara:strand:- start:447 stop:1082 length:636 start_codon:yes stop_codon:yes gene_type:complete
MIFDNLPKIIALFPLSNAIFFPNTILPLNIFEERYIQLIKDCMKNDKMFGMVQPRSMKNLKPDVYKVGCLGKITNLIETNDKRFLISLSGIIRFRIIKELSSNKMYRKFEVNYSDFVEDLNNNKSKKEYNTRRLLEKVNFFFKKKNYIIELDQIRNLSFEQLVSTICMVSPFSVEEKQKLMETVKIEDKLNILEEIINFNLLDNQDNKTIQ